MKLILILLHSFSTWSLAGELEASRACALLSSDYYAEEEKSDIKFYCSLPHRTRSILPNIYWLRKQDYQSYFLLRQPLEPQAPRNLSNHHDDNSVVSHMLNNPRVCQFYSAISPSVQYKRVSEADRIMIVQDADDLIQKCEDFRQKIEGGNEPLCNVIELAGHATQSVGLDTVIGIDYTSGYKNIYPSADKILTIGNCFKKILDKDGVLVTSTCGGEKASDGQYRYWKYKAYAQQELSNILQIPIISGIGPVHFSSRYGPNGTASIGGWTVSKPQ